MTAAAEASLAGEQSLAPLVSVIVPTWNRAQMLRLTLATVLSQEMSDFEVLVIGDGCTDDSEAVVASFGDPRLHWQNLPTNSGAPSIPNNTGIGMARGRYIAHLGHDDFWLPWHLSGLLTTIEESGADWVYSLVVAIGPDDLRHCTGPPRAGVPDAEHHVPPSGWLYRREVAAKVGEWADPASLPWPIDFDYMRRAALSGARFAFHSRPTALKFPSSLFPEGYRTGEPAPIQRQYFTRIQTEPETLEQEILRELATRFAQLDRGAGKGGFAREERAKGSRRRRVENAAACDSQQFQEFQARRRGRMHLRGLASEPEASPQPAEASTDTPPTPALPSAPTIEERLAVRSERRERRRRRNTHIKTRRGPDFPEADPG